MKAGLAGSWGQVGVCLAAVALGASLAAADAPATAWPRSIDTPQGRCTVFQPQPAALDGDRLTARAALAVTPDDSTNVVFGIAQVQARAVQDSSGRLTAISEAVVTQASFAPANAPAMAGLAETLERELANVTWTVPSEEFRAGMDAVERERAAAQNITSRPPKILYRSKPAALVLLDGPPQLRALTNSPLMRVVNTPYAILFDPTGKRYWLQGSHEWFSTPDWRGEWTPVAQPPAEVVAAVPTGAVTNSPALGSLEGGAPQIVVATEPSELVVTRGEPTFTPVAGTDLLYVSNSDQLLFFTIDTKAYYVAFSGRWYRSPALTGPWEAVASDQLPAVFARMTPGSPKSEALTYVAGTVEAQDALLQASIPQITAVERGPADVSVQYDSAPKFQPVESTGVQYAANTADAVFLVGGTYYLCRDAVWYAGPGPDGPWSVASFVPAEIQSLPPSNPHYNVKYVYVYGTTPEVVYVGYSPGYSGCYVSGPTVVYGTGWWYPGYYSPAYCWSYPATFGFGFGYSSWSGWSVGFGVGYGWLGCGYGWGWGGYYPWGWWGPCGAYWACAPRYPCYGGHHRGGPHGDPGGYDRHGGPPPGPPRGGSRSEVRKDAPGPSARPGNPQRRTLPSYARSAPAPQQPPTALRSARGFEPRPAINGGANRPTAPTRMEAGNGANRMPQRTSQGVGGASGQPSRPVAGSRPGTMSDTPSRSGSAQPGRSATSPAASVPTRSAATPVPTAPTRAPATVNQKVGVPSFNTPGSRPSPARPQTAAPSAPVYVRPPGSVQSSSGAWSGSRSTYASAAPAPATRSPSFAAAPVYRSAPSAPAAPSYSGASRAPAMRAPAAAPSAPMRGGYSSGYGSAMRSAPTRSAPAFPGGSMSRGGPSRGR